MRDVTQQPSARAFNPKDFDYVIRVRASDYEVTDAIRGLLAGNSGAVYLDLAWDSDGDDEMASEFDVAVQADRAVVLDVFDAVNVALQYTAAEMIAATTSGFDYTATLEPCPYCQTARARVVLVEDRRIQAAIVPDSVALGDDSWLACENELCRDYILEPHLFVPAEVAP